MHLEQLIGAIADFTRDGVLITEARPLSHPGPKILWCNQAVCDLTGYGRDEIIGATPRLFQGPDTCHTTRQAVRKALADGAPGRFEILNYTKAGAPYWIEMDINPIRDSLGAVVYFVAVERDVTQRRAQEATLARTRGLAQAVMDSAAAGVWVLEPVFAPTGRVEDFVWVDANPTALRALANERDGLIGKRMGDIYPGAWSNGVFEHYARAAETGEPQDFEVHYAADGVDGWFKVSARIASDRLLAVSFLDVSAERRAAFELERVRRNLDAVAANVPGGLFRFAVDKAAKTVCMRYTSAGMADLFGADVIAAGPAALFSRVPGESVDAIWRLIDASASTLEPFSIEHRYDHPTRGVIWVEISARPEREPSGVLAMHGYAHDITARKDAEAALVAASRQVAETSARLSKLTDAVPGVLFQTFVADDGGISHPYLSAGAQALFGLPHAEIVATPGALIRRIHSEDWPLWLAHTRSVNAAGGEYDLTCRFLHPDRGSIHVRTVARAERVEGGTLWHAYSSDVTDAVNREAELREARERAEAGGRAKAAFLATMSHEIRTPMNGVLGMAQALAMQPLPERSRQCVNIILASGQELMRLLDDILDFSRIDAGRVEFEIVPFSPADMLDQIERVHALKAQQKGLFLALQRRGDARRQRLGDRLRIAQVLNNLIGNAIKFTQNGGVTIEAIFELDRLRFVVRDTGVGIEPRHLTRIFERFAQADESISRRFGGSGLGLSISRGLAWGMGGDIAVESEPGVGSTFTFTLPAPLADATEAGGDAERAEAPGGLRVLAAEDNATNRAVLAAILESQGILADFVENGAEAVRRVQEVEYDLILMDISMPVMDGVEATRAIRAFEVAEGRRATPIVAVTANALPQQIRAYAAAGVNAVTPKPIDPNVLFDSIRKALAEAALTGGAKRAEAEMLRLAAASLR